MTRETWATRVGFILAAVGSAVGLGNVWRFPWMTAENGGSAFLAVYLGVVLLVGVPGLLAEFVIGRRANRNPVGALRDLSGSRAWGAAGGIAVVAATVLLSFYSVVGGWILRYFLESIAGLAGAAPYAAEPGAHFSAISFGPSAVAFHLAFLAITGVVVAAGVRRGIEVATKVMMPAIVVLLVALAAWAGTQEGAAAGFAFLLGFDLGTLRANALDLLLPAAGQALFTLSVGAGTMLVYASYVGEDRSLAVDATTIAALNTAVGVLAGLVVFPLLFALEVDPGAGGPGALFVSLAGAFTALPFGNLVAAAFFGVVLLAALSSSISILEIPVAFLVDEFGISRKRAVAGTGALIAVTGTANALRPALFELVAGPVVDNLLALGLLAFLLFAGWTLGDDAVAELRSGAGPIAAALAVPWRYLIGTLLPVFLAFTLLSALGAGRVVGDWGVVGVAVAAVAVAAAVLSRARTRSAV
ncbi:sodium-dependent transporter [Haloparvum sedimenti]|uniref:sodium-dependent transporter n=1 Tax=Haloparvum sedimenti TaxID=1678448 RepID=UPI00071E8FFF|nr:sodium-dependent transporter [Haloparvum sedimenti]